MTKNKKAMDEKGISKQGEALPVKKRKKSEGYLRTKTKVMKRNVSSINASLNRKRNSRSWKPQRKSWRKM